MWLKPFLVGRFGSKISKFSPIFARWTFRIFFIFVLLGGGGGGVRGAGEGGSSAKSQEGGFPGGWGGGRGWEGVCGQLGGGGLNIFFRGRNSHQVFCKLEGA